MSIRDHPFKEYKWRLKKYFCEEVNEVRRSTFFMIEDSDMECCLSLKYENERTPGMNVWDEELELWIHGVTFGKPVFKRFCFFINRCYNKCFTYSNNRSGNYMVLKVPCEKLFLADHEYFGTITVRWIHNPKSAENECPVSAMSKNLEWLLESTEFSDMIIETERGTRFPVHQVLLASRSPVFRAMLKTDMRESKHKCVKISDFSDESISNMLKYMYVGYQQKFEFKQVAELLKIADKYDLADLKYHCAVDLLTEMDCSNASELLLLSDVCSDDLLKLEVLYFIADNRKEFSKDEELSILQKSPHLLTNIITTMANSKDFSESSGTAI